MRTMLSRVATWVLAFALLATTGAVGYAASSGKRASIDVTGEYDTNWGYVYLEQAEFKVWGRYKCCGGGLIKGVIKKGVLHYEWTQPGASGRGHWLIKGKQLRGPWGFGKSERGGGPWNMKRKNRKQIRVPVK